jgi:hypothetical protein
LTGGLELTQLQGDRAPPKPRPLKSWHVWKTRTSKVEKRTNVDSRRQFTLDSGSLDCFLAEHIGGSILADRQKKLKTSTCTT